MFCRIFTEFNILLESIAGNPTSQGLLQKISGMTLTRQFTRLDENVGNTRTEKLRTGRPVFEITVYGYEKYRARPFR